MTLARTLGRALTIGGLLLLTGAMGTVFGQTVLYVPNQGDGTISAFTMGGGGGLAAIPGSPYSAGFTTSNPTRTAITPDRRFLYVANADGSVSGYAISSTGTLT